MSVNGTDREARDSSSQVWPTGFRQGRKGKPMEQSQSFQQMVLGQPAIQMKNTKRKAQPKSDTLHKILIENGSRT